MIGILIARRIGIHINLAIVRIPVGLQNLAGPAPLYLFPFLSQKRSQPLYAEFYRKKICHLYFVFFAIALLPDFLRAGLRIFAQKV